MRLCRRTECQLASPDTLPLCWRTRWEKDLWLFCFYCAKHSNHLDCSANSRSACSVQSNSHHCLCKSLLYEPLFPIQLPSNSDQSDHFYTAAGATAHTSLDDQDMTAAYSMVSPLCCWQTGRDICLQYLGPVWAHRHLRERTKRITAYILATEMIKWLNIIENSNITVVRHLNEWWSIWF